MCKPRAATCMGRSSASRRLQSPAYHTSSDPPAHDDKHDGEDGGDPAEGSGCTRADLGKLLQDEVGVEQAWEGTMRGVGRLRVLS